MASSQAEASSGAAGTGVPWTVEIVTHIPSYEWDDMGLQLTVTSLDGERRELQLQASEKPQQVPRQGVETKDLPGRKDTYAIELPAGFEPAAVLVLDK
jgi:hypothetical protein